MFKIPYFSRFARSIRNDTLFIQRGWNKELSFLANARNLNLIFTYSLHSQYIIIGNKLFKYLMFFLKLFVYNLISILPPFSINEFLIFFPSQDTVTFNLLPILETKISIFLPPKAVIFLRFISFHVSGR
jgi:hypothetical protein